MQRFQLGSNQIDDHPTSIAHLSSMISDALTTVDRLRTHTAGTRSNGAPKVLVRGDSAFYGHHYQTCDRIHRRRRRLDADRVHRRGLRRGHRHLDLAGGEIAFTAFASQKKSHQIPGRLVVRRIPDLRPPKDQGQGTLFDIWRFQAFFTTPDPDDLDTVAPTQSTGRHAVIEQVHADLTNSALAHLPSNSFSAKPPGWSAR